MISESVSIKLSRLSFILSCLIVLHHVDATLVTTPCPWNAFLHNLICRQFAWFAVVVYFTISGFLFAKGRYVASSMSLGQFYISKIKSLLIPYIVFGVLAFLLVTPLIMVNNVVKGCPILVRTVFNDDGWACWISNLIGINCAPAANGALWYVRTLFVLMLFAPIWRFIYRRVSWMSLVLFVALYFENLWWPRNWQYNLLPDKFCYFFLGIYWARLGKEPFRLGRGVIYVLIATWIIISMAIAAKQIPPDIIEMAQRFQHLISVPSIWYIYDIFQDKFNKIDLQLAKKAFFIYCAHSIVWPIFFSPVRYFLGKSDWATLIETPITFIGTIYILVKLSDLTNRRFPKTCAIITGGRR